MTRLVRLVWDRISLNLPVILMGILALGTYWLVRSTPMFALPTPDQPVRHDPDYLVEKFAVKTFDVDGHLRNEIYGDKARHYPDTDILEIDQVRIRSINTRGHVTTATADRALANSDGSEVQLIGNALVVREAVQDKPGAPTPRISFRGEFLHAFLETERVKSHKPVELRRGNDVFTAESLDYDNFDQVLQMRGRVRGTLTQNGSR